MYFTKKELFSANFLIYMTKIQNYALRFGGKRTVAFDITVVEIKIQHFWRNFLFQNGATFFTDINDALPVSSTNPVLRLGKRVSFKMLNKETMLMNRLIWKPKKYKYRRCVNSCDVMCWFHLTRHHLFNSQYSLNLWKKCSFGIMILWSTKMQL